MMQPYRSALVQSRWTTGSAISAMNTPIATKTAPVYDCTAHHATAAVTATPMVDLAGHLSRINAVAIFANAEPAIGFQTSADKHRSIDAVAMRTIVVTASHTEFVRRQTAASSKVSAPDWSMAWPMPPACGRF